MEVVMYNNVVALLDEKLVGPLPDGERVRAC